VIKAIREASNEYLRLYPDPECTLLREAIAKKHGVGRDNVFCGNGSDEVLAFAFGAFFDDVRPVVCTDITYSFYPVYASLWNIPYNTIPAKRNFEIDKQSLLSGVQNCGVVIANPNVPTGILLPLNEIEVLAKKLSERNNVLIVDEAYMPFCKNEKGDLCAHSAVPLLKNYSNILTVHTFSKAYSLAGLRIGYAIGDRQLIEALCRVRDSFNSYTVGTIAQTAAAAAISDTAYYNDIITKVIDTRNRIGKQLANHAFTVCKSDANFLFVKHQTKTGIVLFNHLRDNGILVRHFNKPRISDYLRISIGTDVEMNELLTHIY
jgi:histidinol-phosphate aminotransferase